MDVTMDVAADAVSGAVGRGRTLEARSAAAGGGYHSETSQIANLVSMVFLGGDAEASPSTGRIVALTSPTSGEGVSTIAALMARQLGREESRRTLLIKMAELAALGQGDLENLSSLWVEDPIYRYWGMDSRASSSGLSGQWESNYALRRKVLKQIQVEFDQVLLDCGSIEATADVPSIAALVNGAILVVKAGGSTREQIHNARQVIELAGGKVVGCCLNRKTNPIPAAMARFFGR